MERSEFSTDKSTRTCTLQTHTRRQRKIGRERGRYRERKRERWKEQIERGGGCTNTTPALVQNTHILVSQSVFKYVLTVPRFSASTEARASPSRALPLLTHAPPDVPAPSAQPAYSPLQNTHHGQQPSLREGGGGDGEGR